MRVSIHIAPHERHEAVEAYRDRIGDEMAAAILDAPEGWSQQLELGENGAVTLRMLRE